MPSPVWRSGRPTVSVVLLSYNRRGALEKTLNHLMADPSLQAVELIVSGILR